MNTFEQYKKMKYMLTLKLNEIKKINYIYAVY